MLLNLYKLNPKQGGAFNTPPVVIILKKSNFKYQTIDLSFQDDLASGFLSPYP